MKVYVINLDRRPDRLAFFREQAAARGFAFERIVAVDGTDPALAARAAGLAAGFREKTIGPLQLACFESHRKAWRALLDSEDDTALVMEDDLVVSDDFATLLADDWFPEDADLVRLEAWLKISRFDRKPVARVNGRDLLRMHGTLMGAGAYLISRRTARILIDASERISVPVDQFMFNEDAPLFRQLVIYQMIPAPAIQGFKFNTIHPDQAGEWAESSLDEERAQSKEDIRATGWKRYKIFWRIRYRYLRLQAWLTGTQYTDVPFG